jgi:hypothetical protein
MSKQIFTRLTLAFMLFLTLCAFKAQGQATIKTDLLDYPPGSTAIITGTGFQPGETVTMQVVHVDGDSLGTDPSYHQPFTAIADGSGNISSSWFVPNDGDALGANFKLSAEGGSSGLYAEWFFTDGINKDPSDISVCNGNAASFSVTQTGNGNSLTWQVDIGTGFTDLANVGVYSGVNNLTLNISAATFSMNGYKYRCKDLQSGTTTFSASATLTVRNTLSGATISGGTTVCQNSGSTSLTITNPNPSAVTVFYTINGGSSTSVNIAASSSTLVSASTNTAGTFTYALSSIQYQAVPNCSVAINGQSASVIVRPTPTATISGGTTVCQNSGLTNLTINNTSSGDATIFYTLNGVSQTPLNVAANSSTMVAASTTNAGTFTYALTSIQYQTTPNCSATISGQSAVVEVRVTPTAAIAIFGTNPICSGQTTSIKITGPSSGIVTYNINGGSGITATLNNGGNLTISTATLSANTTYNLVNVSYGDNPGCSASATGSVIITVNQPPVFTLCSSNISTNNDAGVCTAVVNYTSAVTGTPSPTLTYTLSGATTKASTSGNGSGSTFNKGVTTVTITATNTCGTNICSFTVTVKDNEPPVKPTLANITGECSATATAPTTTDNCSGTITGTTSDALTYTTQGTHVITWSFNDGNGNITTATQNVVIKDVTAPVVPTISDVTVGECSGTPIAPTTTDNCAGTITGTTTTVFPITTQGKTVVTWTFSDGNGNSITANQNVYVKDVTAPVPNIVTLANATGECSASVTAPNATDNCVGTVTATTADPISYSAQGSYTVHWTYSDGHGNTSTQNQTVIVKDITAPTITAPGDVSVLANSTCTATNVVLGTPTTGDNCHVASVTNNAPATFSLGSTTVTWIVKDDAGNTTTATQTVTVTNPAPIINTVTPSTISPVQLAQSVTLNVAYTDNNVTNATITWDDLTTSSITNPANPFIISKTYSTPGVYAVTVKLTDACGLTTSYIYQYFVIYDPNGGFVTGGGWINSPAGAYIANLILTGKANFGFVAKYKKGSTSLVDGETEFQFQAGNLKFNSSAYENMSLVIGGAKASYKGTGTINGAGSYKFMLTAIDGDVTNGGGLDKIRMKITDLAGTTTIYDNLVGGGGDNLDPTTVIGGGAIVIHTAKAAREINAPILIAPPITSIAAVTALEAKVMPNPTTTVFNLVIKGKATEPVTVRVTDVYGNLVQLNQKIGSSATLRLGERWTNGTYFVEVIQGTERKLLKVIKAN